MGDMTRVLGEVDRIARRGRNFGFRLISITQRPAKLNKDVLTQLSTLIALGVTSPQDRDAIKAWVDGNADRDKARDVYDSLAHLKVGEGWIWAPDHSLLKRVRFPAITTLDTSKTPKAAPDHSLLKRVRFPAITTLDTSKTPKAGDTRITTPVLAATDIAKLKAAFVRIQSGRSVPKAPTPKRAISAAQPRAEKDREAAGDNAASRAEQRPPSRRHHARQVGRRTHPSATRRTAQYRSRQHRQTGTRPLASDDPHLEAHRRSDRP
jgi:hypothetical protein